MSVLIKGMEMPENCWDCPLQYDYICCSVMDDIELTDENEKKRDSNCPLEEVPDAQPEPSQVARDIATIIENEQDMRVIAKNAQPDLICADCKHYDTHDHRCKWWNHGVERDDYCSRAERKDEHDDIFE